ncbi:hypothetical protein [Thermococcus prieurii]
MKKLAILLIALLVISAGCIGSQGGEKGGSQTKSPSQTNVATTSSGHAGEKKHAEITPMAILTSIHQYTYEENASVQLRITIKTGNTTQRTNASMGILERGYVDLLGKRAKIVTRTVTKPDNVTLKMTRVIIGGTVYTETLGRTGVSNDTSFWRINPVSLAKELLKLTPIGNYTENGTRVLVYSVPGDVLLPMARLYFTNPGMNTTVTDATAELYFSNGAFKGMKLVFSVRATAAVEGMNGKMTVIEVGSWRGTVRITSVNKMEEVKAPST